jgi:hypothetical protein
MLRQKSFSVATTTVFASLLVASLCQVANANPIIGELFYTRFAGTEQVKKVDFAYDGATSFTLGTKTTLATGIGADGITGNPNDPNSLFIDGQGGSLHRVSRDGPSTNGAGTNGVISSTSVPNAAFHLEVPNSTTTRLNTGISSAHGGVYDPLTDTFLTFGDNFISQYTAATGALLVTLDLLSLGIFVDLDQGTVDGAGHILAASNGGDLFFMDYAATGSIATSTFATAVFLDTNLDDVAPLVGVGTTTEVPEPGMLIIFAVAIAGLASARHRQVV